MSQRIYKADFFFWLSYNNAFKKNFFYVEKRLNYLCSFIKVPVFCKMHVKNIGRFCLDNAQFSVLFVRAQIAQYTSDYNRKKKHPEIDFYLEKCVGF